MQEKSLLQQANELFRLKQYNESRKIYQEIYDTDIILRDICAINLNLISNKLNSSNTNYETKTHDVIICVHNALEDVRLCIRSVIDNSVMTNRVIIIDDFSDSETKAMLREYSSKYSLISIVSTTSQLGYTRAANLGLKNSTASFITLLNSDTIVTKNWDEKILSKFKSNSEIGIVGPLSNAASYQSVPSVKNLEDNQTAINGIPNGVSIEDIAIFCSNKSKMLPLIYTPLVHGFCMSISKECINRVGYFDEVSFPRGYGEENDFCVRAGDAGFALSIATDVYVYHSKSKSYTSADRQQFMVNGWNELVKKHTKKKLTNYVNQMETHPVLEILRKEVYQEFYKLDNTRKICSDFGKNDGMLKSIAFYLPQFHPIPENDEWWEAGFTEWTNVVTTKARFPDHEQPKLPGKLGFYDLRLNEIMTEQSKMAQEYGISGFCFYYYRFGAKRLLEKPINNYLQNKDAETPFCYCWANEPWTRAWDGKTKDVLIDQSYDLVTLSGFINDLEIAISDERYINVNGKPVVLIYQLANVIEPKSFISQLRKDLKVKTGKDILIGSVFSSNFDNNMLSYIDFVVQFPPHRIPRVTARWLIKDLSFKPFDESRDDYYESYDAVVEAAINGANEIDEMFLGVCPDWDNSARRSSNANILIGSTPEKFGNWCIKAGEVTIKKHTEKKIPAPIVFINAWNEWAEGAILEPTKKHGYKYIEAFSHAKTHISLNR